MLADEPVIGRESPRERLLGPLQIEALGLKDAEIVLAVGEDLLGLDLGKIRVDDLLVEHQGLLEHLDRLRRVLRDVAKNPVILKAGRTLPELGGFERIFGGNTLHDCDPLEVRLARFIELIEHPQVEAGFAITLGQCRQELGGRRILVDGASPQIRDPCVRRHGFGKSAQFIVNDGFICVGHTQFELVQ